LWRFFPDEKQGGQRSQQEQKGKQPHPRQFVPSGLPHQHKDIAGIAPTAQRVLHLHLQHTGAALYSA